MRTITFLLAVFLTLAFSPSSAADDADDKVTITFNVSAPGDTDPDAKLYVAANLDEAGKWKSDGVLLKHRDDGRWAGSVRVPKGAKLEYKVTGGNWETVETDEQGNPIENRKLECTADMEEKIIVLKFNTPPTSQPSTQPSAMQKRASTATGDIRRFPAFQSKLLNNERDIQIWCPPGYDNSKDRYPVLYMHDGQNVFDAATSFAGEWRADETALELIQAGKVPPFLIVAIANRGGERIREYTPSVDDSEPAGGGAEKYARFLVEELKPRIDATFRTLSDPAHTGVCGSSLGGLVSLYICDKYPGTFGLCGAMSPSLWWGKREMLTRIAANPASLSQCRVWLDMGTKEGSGVDPSSNVANVRDLGALLEKAGMKQNENLAVLIDDGKEHNEAAWAGRLDKMIVFLLCNEK